MISIGAIVALCIASAVLGRLVLTREEARRTVTVRAPALCLLLVAAIVSLLATLILAVAFFVGGGFYGLGAWWWPTIRDLWCDPLVCLAQPVLSGSWE